LQTHKLVVERPTSRKRKFKIVVVFQKSQYH